MKRKTSVTSLTLFFLVFFQLFGGVNLKNGNFYISYTDVDLEAFHSAYSGIIRTYNSKSIQVGLFGFGWGTEIETHLSAYPDGTIVVKENGSGSKNYFKSLLITADMLELMIDELIETTIGEGDLKNIPKTIIKRRNKLMGDLEYRTSQWDKYAKKGMLEYVLDFPVGMEWESYKHGNQLLVKNENGYVRTEGREIETFDIFGKLIKIDDGQGNYTALEYENSNLVKLINADESELHFTSNTDGFITSITSQIGTASYTYDGQDLIAATDTGSNVYNYTYDNNHNMTSIGYADGTSRRMEYHPKTQYVKRITARDDTFVDYEYQVFYKEDGTVDNDHYSTSVIKEGYYGKVTNYYEYKIRTKPNGSRYTYMISTKINNVSTTTYYDELCSKPTEITRGEHTTSFKYNNRCLLIEKIATRGDSIYMKYHPKFEKLTYVKNMDGVTEFEYDAASNLIYAKKDEDTWMKLSYNAKGKIASMNQNDKVLTFEYNALDKPSKIIMEGVGEIIITYDKYGEISGVNSEEGNEMALQVTQAFQNMLALIKPAGVNLGI